MNTIRAQAAPGRGLAGIGSQRPLYYQASHGHVKQILHLATPAVTPRRAALDKSVVGDFLLRLSVADQGRQEARRAWRLAEHVLAEFVAGQHQGVVA